MSGGSITRKEIISDDAINWGDEYVKNVDKAISKNDEFVQSILKMADANKKLKEAGNPSELTKKLKEYNDEAERGVDIWKQRDEAEAKAAKTRREAASATAAATDADKKKQISQAAGNRLTSEEIVNQRILAKNADTLALINSKLASEYDKLTAKARLAARALHDIMISGKGVGESTLDYNIRLQRAQIEFDRLQAKVIAANRAIGKFNDNVGNYPKNAVLAIKDLVEAFGLVTGVQLFVSVTKQAFNIIKDFEAEMVNLAAIAGFTRAEIAPLEGEIRRVAKVSINSATDVAKLATELIKLGSTPEEAMKLLEPINNLSVALRASAEDAAGLVKGLLNAYGEGADQAARYTDVLAESANRSALDFDGLRDAFSYLAPTAKTLGLSLEETAAILGTLADNNIKAETAGRLTSTAFIRLASNGLTLEAALKQLNDAQAKGKTRMEILTLAGKLFGAEAAKIGMILASNVEKTKKSTEAYKNSSGALQELTDKQLKSLSAELEILSSAWEEYLLNANEANGGTEFLTGTVRYLSDNLSSLINIAIYATGLWLSYRAAIALANIQARLMALSTTASSIAQAQNAAVVRTSTITTTTNTEAKEVNNSATNASTTAQFTNAGATRTTTTAIGFQTIANSANASAARAATVVVGFQTQAMKAAAVAQEANVVSTNLATLAWQRFSLALKANALGLAVAALIAFYYYTKDLHKSLSQVSEETQKSTDSFLKQREVVARNVSSLNTLADRYDALTEKAKKLGGVTKLTIEEQKELDKITKVLAKTVPEATTAMDKYGDALTISSDKIRDYVKLQKEVITLKNADKLKENIDLLKKLKKEQSDLNVLSKEGKAVGVKDKDNGEFAIITNVNGVLKTRNNIFQEYRELTASELLLYKKKVLAVDTDVIKTENQIKALNSLADADKNSAKKKAEGEQIKQEASVRTIEIIDAEIKALKDSIPFLSDKTGKEGDAIKAKIKALEAERELIYSTEKADKKAAKDRIKNLKDVRDAIFQLEDNRLSHAMKVNDEIIANEKKSWDDRYAATYDNLQLEEAQIDLRAKHELESIALSKTAIKDYSAAQLAAYMKTTEDRIDLLLKGKIAVKDMSTQELVIVEDIENKKTDARRKGAKDSQEIIDSQVDAMKRRIESEVATQERATADAVEAENVKFLAIYNAETDFHKTRERAVRDHEKKIADIKFYYAKAALKDQINALETLLNKEKERPVNERISADKIKKIEEELSDAKMKLSEFETEEYKRKLQEKQDAEKKFRDEVTDLSQQLTSSLIDLADAIFQARISSIDNELQALDAYYAKQQELAGDDQRKKDLLTAEAEKKREQLEKKKREEQRKQAIFDKVMKLAQIGIATALAIMQAYAQAGPFGGTVAAVLIAALAAAQTAAVIATPIPKYKTGRTDGPEETAIVGDGGVREVISNQDGSDPRITPDRPTVVRLRSRERVHRSIESYNQYMRQSLTNKIIEESRTIREVQAAMYVETNNSDVIDELKDLKNVLKNKRMQVTVQTAAPDYKHMAWALSNKNWKL